MKKTSKKVIAILMAMMVAQGCFIAAVNATSIPVASTTASDTTYVFQESDFSFGSDGKRNYATTKKYTGNATNIKIPGYIKKNGKIYYVKIEQGSFRDNANIKTVSIANGAVNIGSKSFQNCTSLTSISLPNTIENIGTFAFRGCSKLQKITIPSKVKTIPYYSFADCTNLTNVTISKGTNKIGPYAFYNCNSLKGVTIPEGVTIIDDNSFAKCYNLRSVIIPEGLKTIGYSAFYNCASLKSVTIPNSVYGLSGEYNIETVTRFVPKWGFGKLENHKQVVGFTVFGTKGTDAELYAKANKFAFYVADEVKLNKSSLTLGKGETYTLKAFTGSNNKVTWSTNNSNVVTVSGGKVIAKNNGTVVITAKIPNGKTARCKITVKAAPSKISLNKTSITVGIGEQFDFNSYLPSGTASHRVVYSSSNSAVASVNSAGGIMTAKKVGTAVITAKTFNGKTATCKVTVKKAPTGISLNKTKLTLKVGEKFDLNSSLPSGYASYSVVYTSSNPSVATVKASGGLVTAIKKGSTTITAKTYNGKTAICSIFVK
mgnify:CR=1 FL=1